MRALRSVFAARVGVRRRIAISLSAALLVIAGLLAMHGFNVDAGHASMGSGTPIATPADLDHHATPAEVSANPIEQCGDGCGGEGHLAMTMICVLALMVASLALLALPVNGARGRIERLLRWLTASASHAAPLRPPSLIILSISRT